jgi:hypothetical protein
MCRCHSEIDAKLEPLNGRLATGFSIAKGAPVGATMQLSLLMQVEKIAPRGKKPPQVLPTFCPFCGEKLTSKAA